MVQVNFQLLYHESCEIGHGPDSLQQSVDKKSFRVKNAFYKENDLLLNQFILKFITQQKGHGLK